MKNEVKYVVVVCSASPKKRSSNVLEALALMAASAMLYCTAEKLCRRERAE
ncbi:MAG: hypothetical protein NC120_13070 [Ruminococcus sp.]|nr:hypothetical protein [Ruminococcus sp.]